MLCISFFIGTKDKHSDTATYLPVPLIPFILPPLPQTLYLVPSSKLLPFPPLLLPLLLILPLSHPLTQPYPVFFLAPSLSTLHPQPLPSFPFTPLTPSPQPAPRSPGCGQIAGVWRLGCQKGGCARRPQGYLSSHVTWVSPYLGVLCWFLPR